MSDDVREKLEELEKENARLREALEECAYYCKSDDGEDARDITMYRFTAYKLALAALNPPKETEPSK